MRKCLLITVAVIVVGLAIPYGTGIMAEKRFYEVVQKLDAANPKVTLTVNDYHRGWFKSSAAVTVVATMYGAVKATPVTGQTPPTQVVQPPQPKTIKTVLNESIKHGPILIGKHGVHFGMALVTTKLNLANGTEKQFAETFTKTSQVPEMQSTMVFKYFGKVVTDIEVPVFKLVMKDNKGNIDWQGLTMHWTLSRNLDHLDGNLKFNGATVQSEKSTLQMGKGAFFSESHEGYKDLWLGSATVLFPQMQVITDKKLVFFTGGFKLVSDSNITNKLISQNIDLDFQKTAFGGGVFGPGSLSMLLNNIDADALSELAQQVKVINDPKLDPQQRKLMAMGLIGVLPKLLDKGPSIEIKKLMLQMPDGLITGKGAVSMKPVAKGGEPNPITGLLQRLSMDFNIELPVATVERVLAVNAYKSIAKQQQEQQLIAKQKALTALAAAGEKANQQPTDAQIAAQSSSDPQSQQDMVRLAHQNADKQISQWVSQGFLIKEGQVYHLVLQFKDKKFTINGKTLQLSGQMSLLNNILNPGTTTVLAVPTSSTPAQAQSVQPASQQVVARA